MSLFKSTVHWFYRYFISFIAIVLILVAARYVLQQVNELVSVKTELSRLQSLDKDLDQFIGTREAEATRLVHELGRESTEAIKQRIATLDAEIALRQSGPYFREITPFDVLKGTGIADILRTKVELEILGQERAHLALLLNFREGAINLRLGRVELERLRLAHVDAYGMLMENRRAQEALKDAYRVEYWIPWTEAFARLGTLRKEHRILFGGNQDAFEVYQRQKKVLDFIDRTTPKEVPAFKVPPELVLKTMRPLQEAIETLDARRRDNLIDKVSGMMTSVVPTALLILVILIVSPIAIKAFLYFIVAPMASRRPAICLIPEASGVIANEGESTASDKDRPRISSVSKAVILDEGHELLVHPEYLQSTSREGEKDTKFLLDWAYPISSLASGMFALTRIRAASREPIVISSTKDPFSEVGVISIPDGAAVVIQPHGLVGVIQHRDSPIRITRHWRLASLHAWLTLQFRYLAFHGPAILIVKGCRGIRIESAGSGRHLNQAATIGFSANILYSTTRCETFTSYLLGKQELFNDNFEGGPGFYVYEEMPRFGQKTGLLGRGLEGVIDSFMKAFGV